MFYGDVRHYARHGLVIGEEAIVKDERWKGMQENNETCVTWSCLLMYEALHPANWVATWWARSGMSWKYMRNHLVGTGLSS